MKIFVEREGSLVPENIIIVMIEFDTLIEESIVLQQSSDVGGPYHRYCEKVVRYMEGLQSNNKIQIHGDVSYRGRSGEKISCYIPFYMYIDGKLIDILNAVEVDMVTRVSDHIESTISNQIVVHVHVPSIEKDDDYYDQEDYRSQIDSEMARAMKWLKLRIEKLNNNSNTNNNLGG